MVLFKYSFVFVTKKNHGYFSKIMKYTHPPTLWDLLGMCSIKKYLHPPPPKYRKFICFLMYYDASWGTGRYGTGRYGTGRYGTGRYDTRRYGTGRYDTGRYGTLFNLGWTLRHTLALGSLIKAI